MIAVPDGLMRRRRPLGYLALAVLAYVPLLLTARGKVAADTKQYLYLDPARLLSRSVSMWDPAVGLGTVPHQTIGYLWPMGPYYWTFEKLGVPDWIAQRLWLGSLLFAAALGVLYLLRTFAVKGPGVVIATLAYMLTPYTLNYAARISVLLMPWAALPWLIGLVRRALRDGGWRYPACFALVVQCVGGVNATALLLVGIGPALFVLYDWLIARESTARRAVSVTAKVGGLTIATSLWWMAGLSIQGQYGIDILKYTETVKTVAITSTPNEVLRGLGHWFFYGRDQYGPWIEATKNYTKGLFVLSVSYALAAASLLAAGVLRWRHRAFFVLLLLIGVVIAVGAHPYASPTPLGSLFKRFASASTAGLALRNTGRAVPLVVLSLAVLLGCAINAISDLRKRSVAVGVVAVMILANMPALVDGSFYAKNLERPESIPTYWTSAINDLDRQSHDTRVIELPGSDFAAYRWGNNLVDPITPGLMDRPYVARELIPLGSPESSDLLNALDRRFQEGASDPQGVAAVLRRMGIGTVVLRNDVQWERYHLVSVRELNRIIAKVPGLTKGQWYGPGITGEPTPAQVDETALASPTDDRSLHPISMYEVENPTSIVRAESDQQRLLIAGDGEGIIDAANAGLLDDAGVVQYAGSFPTPDALRAAASGDTVLVVTDQNRQRGRRWNTIVDNFGYTEQRGEEPIADPSDARLELFPGAPADAFTTTRQIGVKSVRASGYGNTISFTPEDRASMAFDGDTATQWRADAFGPGVGQALTLTLDNPVTTDHINVVQPSEGSTRRNITRVRLSFDKGRPVEARLGANSRAVKGQTITFPKRTFSSLTITITETNFSHRPFRSALNAVGFAEIRVRDDRASSDVSVAEVVEMPTDIQNALGDTSASHPLVFLMTRQRVRPTPPRRDPEATMVRDFYVPTARAFALTGTARVQTDASSQIIDAALGIDGVTSVEASATLAGCVTCRGSSAIDNDARTAWNTPLSDVRGQWLRLVSDTPVSFDRLKLSVLADGRHSQVRRIRLDVDGQIRHLDVPQQQDRSQENAVANIDLTFPAVSGRRIEITLEKVDPLRTFNLALGADVALPVGIAEIGIPGLTTRASSSKLPTSCRTDLLSIDGQPVGLRVEGLTSDAERMNGLDVSLCSGAKSIALDAGHHVVKVADGRRTGLALDRLALTSPAPQAAVRNERAIAASVPRVQTSRDSSSRMVVHVAPTDKPFWLVLGESYNKGWTARIAGGASLGAPSLVDGYANGWRVAAPPSGTSGFDIVLEWTPQRRVWIALWASLLMVALCVGIVVVALVRRRVSIRTTESAQTFTIDTPASRSDALALAFDVPLGTSVAGRARAFVVLGGGALAAFVVAPWVGALVALVLLAGTIEPRVRWVTRIGPGAFVGIAGLYIAFRQSSNQFPTVLEWPTLFPAARTLAWLAVVLLVCDLLLERVSRRPPPP